jgi:uncharacterized membrane protein YozB (DUF420 family)
MQASSLALFPAVNASLNGLAALLLLTGKRLIARHEIDAHKRAMIAAFGSSVLFLICYLCYHTLRYLAHLDVVRFPGQGWHRSLYLTLLGSHTILAVVIVPLILITLRRGLNRQDTKHIRLAGLTYWLWLYVSVTGVIIYYLLYHLWRA